MAKTGDTDTVGFDELLFGSGRNRYGIDEVAIKVIKDEDVSIATDGRSQEGTGLVGEDPSGGGDTVGVDCMSSCWWRLRGTENIMRGGIRSLG